MREKYENIPANMKVREGIGREMLQVLEQRFPRSLGRMEEQITTLQHVEDPTLEEVDIS